MTRIMAHVSQSALSFMLEMLLQGIVQHVSKLVWEHSRSVEGGEGGGGGREGLEKEGEWGIQEYSEAGGQRGICGHTL